MPLKKVATTSFDYLVGPGQQRGRHGKTERLRGLKIDDEMKQSRLLNREVCGLGTFNDFIDVPSGLLGCRQESGSVGHQATFLGKGFVRVDRGELQAERQCGDARQMILYET